MKVPPGGYGDHNEIHPPSYIPKKGPMKARKIIGSTIQIIGLLIAAYPVIKWIQHPELTEMQMFLSWWWIYLICIGVFYIGTFIKK